MQHPDEGTIHSWLDYALPAEDAARVESHVAECAQCAAKVAEARGFIAASSRILTALDDVPRGVIPVMRPKSTRFGPAWRAAAAVLVVAGASVLVLQSDNRSQDGVFIAPMTTADTQPAATRSESAAVSIGETMPTNSAAAPVTSAPRDLRRTIATTPPPTSAPADRRSETVMQSTDAAKAADMQAATGSVVAGTVTAMDLASPLRLVSDSSRIASRSLRYAVGMSDTVTLVESVLPSRQRSATSLNVMSAPAAVSKTTEANERRTQAPMPAPPAPPPPPAEFQVPPMAGAVAGRAESTAGVNTIRWVDPATGKAMSLSGKLSVARLEEIRREIEKQRAAERKTR